MLKKRSIILVGIISILLISGVLIYKSKKGENYYTPIIIATHDTGEHYVGSETCKECHEDIYNSHINTAHFNTSALANKESILGSFETGSNELSLSKLDLKFTEEIGHLYQHSQFPSGMKKSEQFNVVIGSGVKGQTYLTWDKDALFQLQGSYYTPTNSWINSPGYPGQYLKRPVRETCLKCHFTYAKNKDFSGRGNQFERKQIIYGIDCERCHRPSSKHVIYHRKNPKDKIAKFTLSLDSLPQQKKLDVCAQCHSGMRENVLQGNSFSFLAGENLDEYARNHQSGNIVSNSQLDVHGNQYGLLKSSECFINSGESFSCTSCHNPHKKQRGNFSYFNSKCIGCHTNSDKVECSGDSAEITKMENNCISCHMPTKPSKVMAVQLAKDSLETAVYVRTHLIGIYPKEEWSNE